MASYVALAALVAVVVWTFVHLPKEHDLGSTAGDVAKLREYLVLDIRGANHYCLGYIALLGVVGTMAASRVEALRPLLSSIPIWPFAAAFLASTLSLMFVPAGYGTGSFTKLKVIWIRTILCEQITVVSMAFGLWSVFAAIIGG